MKKLFFAVLILLFWNSFFAQPLKREPFNKNLFFKKSFRENGKEVVKREMDSGKENLNNPPPFDFQDGERLLKQTQNLMADGKIGLEYKEKLENSLFQFEVAFNEYKNNSSLTPEETIKLMDLKYRVENLLGAALKKKSTLKAKRFYGVNENQVINLDRSEGLSKVNTGWILDQKIYDATVEKWYPTMPIDIRSYDEGASDTEVDDEGWVWHVQSFYFTDPLLDDYQQPTHANPSYCLAIYLSPDGGPSWMLYEILYDPDGKDIINPKLCIDILPSANRFFIAYEYAYSETDHDIYVYSENFSSSADPQDVPIATSALMERNPDIASDFYQGQTSYRVVVFEKEASLGSFNLDIYGCQSTGTGAQADWSSPIAIASDQAIEKNPALSNGASGYSTITQYMHLAYNYDLLNSDQLLLNNGFELGNNGDWIVNSAGDIDCSGSYQRTGSCCVWLAGINNYTDFIYQDVTIPANAFFVNLSFYLKISSAEGTTEPYDHLYIQLRDTSNNLITTLQTFSNVDKNTYQNYQQLNYNLLSYSGQTVRIYFYATTDATLTTSFFIDDTLLDVVNPSGYEVRYAKANHPGATPYPTGLQSFPKLTVLSSMNDPYDWQYGPPTIIATHGGSSSMTPARVVVAADQHFPADTPYSGDLDRHQICFAWSLCNGSTTCGTMNCGGDNITLNWQEAWFYDGKGDERFPSLIPDGSGLPTKGLDIHPYIYMAYFHRLADEPTGLGEIQLLLSDPSDETCDGFIQGYWYYFTNSYTATDPDNLVSPKARTINVFNYWDGWPGITFNKKVSHQGGGTNDDLFVTTLGDNYTFYTFSNGEYLDIVVSLNDVTYSTPHTFPWAGGYKWDIIAVTPQEQSPYNYEFSDWSNGQTDPKLTVVSDFCDPINPCPEVNYTAFYNWCIMSLPEVQNCLAVKSGSNDVQLSWDPLSGTYMYAIYQSSQDPSLKSNFKLLDTVASTSFLDTTSSNPGIYYYIVVGRCSKYDGDWGGSYDQ